jgi:cytochrome o ubiquinol oxidase subunit II
MARASLAASAMLVLTGCNRGIFDPVGPVAAQEKQLLINSTAIMLAIIIPTMIATVAVAWWFRRGNTKATYRPDWEYSGAIEMVVWGIPVLTVMLLAGIAWIGSHRLEPSRPLPSDKPPLRVEVVSLDWKWLFIYPDQGIATVNQLVVPAGTPVSYRLTSATVWNVFWVPQMGTMIYTMPRMTTRLNLQAGRARSPESPGTSAATASPGCSSRSNRFRRTSSRCGRKVRAARELRSTGAPMLSFQSRAAT